MYSYCKECTRKRAAEIRAKNPEHAREIMRRSVEKNRDLINARKRARRAANPEKTKAQRALNYQKYRNKELAAMRKWKDANRQHMAEYSHSRYWADVEASRKKQVEYLRTIPGVVRERAMRRNAQKLCATPAWADIEALREFYSRAADLTRETGEPHEVDHIVPLQSKLVCGLHCEANLQVITRTQNRTKCNRHWPDMP